jgi:urate oxidase
MALLQNTYGKGRVRVLRLYRDGQYHEPRETSAKVLLEGDFSRSYTGPDNSTVIATDSIKNIVNVVGRENLRLSTEEYGVAIAKKFLDGYPQVERVNVELVETQWQRLSFDGKPHDYSFTRIGNGNPIAKIVASRNSTEIESGVDGFTFMKTTESGWVDYVTDEHTSLAETRDRVAATSMLATWRWTRNPKSFPEANNAILQAMIKEFATTYSEGVQDSMYRMGLRALEAMPEISEVAMAMPNLHYIPMNLSHFKLDNPGVMFLPTNEPHGQIQCTVGRDK